MVDLVEPPLGGLLASTSGGQRWSDEMELDADEEELEQNAQDFPDNPSESNISLR